jgi:hypothetical protein
VTDTVDHYRKQTTDEHSLQVLILRHLNMAKRDKDVIAFAIPNAGKRSLRMGARMREEGLTRGVADLCVLLPKGRTGWLECKTSKGKQSDEQMGFEARCKRLGHYYAVVRNIDEALDELQIMGAIR